MSAKFYGGRVAQDSTVIPAYGQVYRQRVIHCLNHRPGEIEVRVKMLVSCIRTERPRGPLLQLDVELWYGLCRIGGSL